MRAHEIPITTPCGADWSEMTPTEARARMCAACNKVVHDLSAMDEREVRAKIASGPSCVRYLYDAHGRVVFGPVPAGARVIPAGQLLTRAAKSKWLRAATVAAAAIVFEACGGNDGGRYDPVTTPARDAGPRTNDETTPHVPADAGVADADADAGDAASDAEEPDAG